MVRWAGFWNCYKIRYLINTTCTTRKSTTHIKWGQYNMKYKNCEKLRYHKICHPIKTVFSSLKWNQTRIETGNYSDRRSVWNFSGAVSMGSLGLTKPISFQKRIQNQRKHDDIMVFCYIVCINSKTFLVVWPRFWVVWALERLPTWKFDLWDLEEVKKVNLPRLAASRRP